MKKLAVAIFIVIFAFGMISISLVSDQFVDAGSRKKVHFTQTVISSQDPGQGHENHQFVLLLSPNQGSIYDGSMTFTSSENIQVAVLHEINSEDVKGQDVWTVDGNNIYALSLIDAGEKSGSLEFTGAALALHSMDSKEFTATVSIDAWIRGQPTEVMMQKIELEKENSLLPLSRSSVLATIPMHQGLYEGKQVLFIVTDGSDEKYTETISENQGWQIEHAPSLKDIPEDSLQSLFVFKNGVIGNGFFGFQDEIVSNTPSQVSDYSALSSIIEVTWKPGQHPTLLESNEDVVAAEEGGRIEFTQTGIVLNTPQIIWPDGQMKMRSNQTITNENQYGGGQIIEINEEEMTVTFVAHRGWGPDGRTIYYIITDVTPSGPAEALGVASSMSSANLISYSGTADLFQFKNGIKGSGPLGFQPTVATTALGYESYSPIWKIYMVDWHDSNSAQVLETVSDIDFFRSEDLISVSIARPSNDDHIVNSPLIDPFQ